MKRSYLTDGVYVHIDKESAYPVVFTTGHHDKAFADNVVYLELSALKSLIEWCVEEGVLNEASA